MSYPPQISLSSNYQGRKPIIDKQTEILILGTSSGVSSDEYYSHPANQFWDIIITILQKEKTLLTYDDKINILKNNRIGLWDVLYSCEILGDKGNVIHKETLNDFPSLFQEYANIKSIVFNGESSYQAFMKYYKGRLKQRSIILPSTSKTYRSLDFSSKLKQWESYLKIFQ